MVAVNYAGGSSVCSFLFHTSFPLFDLKHNKDKIPL